MTKTATQKVTQVCVLDQNGQPLMPTQRLGKVYRLLKTKKAHIVAYEPFTVQLDYEPKTHIIQPLTLGVDSGAIHSGYSIANEHREYYSAEVIARDDISKNISDKRMYRRNRRSRKTRYRKPRFNNRKNKGKGWIPPSLEQKVSVQVKEIEHLHQYFPIKDIIIEIAEFDIQKIKNPDMHMIPKARNGSNRVDNLTLSCHDCNQKKGTLTAEEFIEQALSPQKAAQKLRQLPKTKQLLKYMAHMNATRWVLYNTIKEIYNSVSLTYGYITKHNRINAGLPKAHHIDAKCITGFSTVPSFDVIVVKTKMRRHNRQLHRATFSKGHVRRAATLPRIVHDFQLYDIVLFNNHRYYIKSRRSSGSFTIVSLEGLKDEKRSYKKLTFLGHTNTYLTNHHVNDEKDYMASK